MTWSRKDIIADIKKEKYNVDTSLLYWELRSRYRQARYTRDHLAFGGFGYAQGRSMEPPPENIEEEKEET